MLTALENYYLKQPEPIRECLLAMKEIILRINSEITHERKYQIPFFYYKGKKLCFLWVDRKKPLLGFVIDRKLQPLIAGVKRKDTVETILLDPTEDLPIEFVIEKLQQIMALYDQSETYY